MALSDKREVLLAFIKSKNQYLQHNADLFKIHEGGLLPFVAADMRKAFSEQYFSTIESRILPINILRRYIDKVSKAYLTDPIRTPSKKRFEKTLRSYEYCFDMNTAGMLADRWGNLFKGYAWEIFHHKGKPRLRAIPYDRFLVYSDDPVDPMSETAFIKIMGKMNVQKGKDMREVEVYFVCTDTEFDAFDSDGDTYVSDEIVALGGVNPYGVIPYVYGNRSLSELMPTQDSDIMPITKAIPVLVSDLSGAIMYQAFSVVYGIDVKEANIKIAPNAFWSLKSEESSDKTPSVGVIKPEVDISQVVNYIMTMFGFWLETKGVRVGSVGNIDSGNTASGIAKMIDEMDTYEIRKENIKFFMVDEGELWHKVRIINNYWLQNDIVDGSKYDLSILGEDFDVTVEFDEPAPNQNRMDVISEEREELAIRTTTLRRSIKRLHPEWDEKTVEEVMTENDVVIDVPATDIPDGSYTTAEAEGPGPNGDLPMPVGDLSKSAETKRVALNGAQVTAVNDLIKDVALGQVPAGSAVSILILAFGMSEDEAASMIRPAETFSPRPITEPRPIINEG